MFTPSDVTKVEYVINSSGAAAKLEALRGKQKAGRPSGLTTHIFLVGALLSALDGDGMVLTNLYDVLTRRMDFQRQVELGVRDSVCSPVNFTQDAVDRLSVSLRDALEFGDDSAPDLSDEERERRRDGLQDLIDAMLDATLIPTFSSYRSIDATGVWAWGRSPRQRGIKALEKEAAELEKAGRTDDVAVMLDFIDRMKNDRSTGSASTTTGTGLPASTSEDPAADADSEEGDDEAATTGDDSGGEAPMSRRPHDPDARSSGKTAKDGRTEWYYGYHLNALVRVAEPTQVYTSEPRLIERSVVTPAGRNLIWASRELIRRAQPSEYQRMVLGDRWYSNLLEDNWYLYLRANGWTQAVDMREPDQRWTDVRGMRVTAGWCHCPATPDEFERITKPIGKKDDFYAAIAARQEWAFELHSEDTERGTRRLICPACAGKVRCPLRKSSLRLPADRPWVENAPEADTAPDCCTVETTVTVHVADPNAKGRLWQPLYWGTPNQVAQTDRRTSVEQLFSRMKDREGVDMSRGFVRVTGLARVTLAVGLLAVATNIRELEKWASEYDDDREPGHPLLQPRDQFVVRHLSLVEAQELEEYMVRKRRRSA
jgi:hypothetical protein